MLAPGPSRGTSSPEPLPGSVASRVVVLLALFYAHTQMQTIRRARRAGSVCRPRPAGAQMSYGSLRRFLAENVRGSLGGDRLPFRLARRRAPQPSAAPRPSQFDRVLETPLRLHVHSPIVISTAARQSFPWCLIILGPSLVEKDSGGFLIFYC